MTPRHTSRTIMVLCARVILALAGLASGVAQLAGAPALVSEFEIIGFGQWFRYSTGLILIAGAVLLTVKSTIGLGALLLLSVCVGAFAAHVLVLHGDLIHVVIPAAMLTAIAWQHRDHMGLSVRAAR